MIWEITLLARTMRGESRADRGGWRGVMMLGETARVFFGCGGLESEKAERRLGESAIHSVAVQGSGFHGSAPRLSRSV